MKFDWKQKTLGELLSYIAKGIPPKYSANESDNTIHVLNQKCNRDFSISFENSRLHDNAQKRVPDEKVLKIGDVLINSTGTGTAGRVAQLFELPFTTTFDGHMILLRPTNEIEKFYFGYAIKQWQTTIEELAEGSTGQTEINRQRLCDEIIITYPSDLSHQKFISSLLYNIDQKIAINTAINEILNQHYLTIIDHFLSNLTEYKICSLTDIAECQNGRAFYKEGYDAEGAFVIDLGNVNTSGNFVYTNADKYISMERYNNPKLEHYRVYKDDLIMVMTDRKSTMDLLGKVGKIYKDGFYVLNQRMYRIRAKKCINTNYLYAYLNSNDTHKSLKEKALGSVQKYVNTGEINSIQVKVPSSDKMNELATILDPIFQQMENNYLEKESLTELRNTLLPKLMNGEIDVSAVKI